MLGSMGLDSGSSCICILQCVNCQGYIWQGGLEKTPIHAVALQELTRI